MTKAVAATGTLPVYCATSPDCLEAGEPFGPIFIYTLGRWRYCLIKDPFVHPQRAVSTKYNSSQGVIMNPPVNTNESIVLFSTNPIRPNQHYSDAPFFCLDNGDLKMHGSCVIAMDKTHPTNPRYMLITNHHLLPKLTQLNSCKLIVDRSGRRYKKYLNFTNIEIKLNTEKHLENQVKSFFSCCGKNSVWVWPGGQRPKSHAKKCCPRREDWTVVILNKEFVKDIISDCKLDEEKFMQHDFQLRVIENTEVLALQLNTSDNHIDVGILERFYDCRCTIMPVVHNMQPDFENFKEDSPILRIQYPYRESGDIGVGCSGAPIVIFKNNFRCMLLGIHCSIPSDPTIFISRESGCRGLSVNFIISSLYCGKRLYHSVCS